MTATGREGPILGRPYATAPPPPKRPKRRSKPPSVWVLRSRSFYDMSDAARYGEIREFWPGNINIFDIEELASEVIAACAKFETGDYLVKTGDLLAFALTLLTLRDTYQHRQVKVLIWSSKETCYMTRVVDFDAIEEAAARQARVDLRASPG